MVTVIDNGHGLCVSIQPLQLRNALKHDADADFPASDDGDGPIHIRHNQVCEIVQIEPHGDLQPVVRSAVSLRDQRLQCLRIEEGCQCLERKVRLMHLVDSQNLLKEEISLASFAAGFKLAWGLSKELEADGLYSFDEDETERICRRMEQEE